MAERTLSIIKPDAVAKNKIGEIYRRFEDAGLQIVGAQMMHLSREQAEQFYAVHSERGFFNELVSFMISGPVMASGIKAERKDVIPGFAGQGIGLIDSIRPAAEVMRDLVDGAEKALASAGIYK